MQQHSDIRSCLESWEDELRSRAKRVRRLIGDKHWLSDGLHKESIVVEFLRRHLPLSVHISRGFVVNGDPQVSPTHEIDILISSFLLDCPWFSEGDLTIVSPKSCLAQLHVKTEFNQAEVDDVFESCSHSAMVAGEKYSESCFFGAIFFETNKVTGPHRYKEIIANSIAKLSVVERLPDVITVVNGPVIISRNGSVKGYNGVSLSLAILLNALRDKIAVRMGSESGNGEMSMFLQQLNYTPLFTIENIHS